MDSGSWFAIWAICLRTSFFVMMPRSLLEKKQNRKKEVNLAILTHAFPRTPVPLSPGHPERQHYPASLAGGCGQLSEPWPMEWVRVDMRGAPPRLPHISSHSLSSTASQRHRSQWRTLRSQGIDKEPPDAKTYILEWLCCRPHTCCNWYWI